MIILNQHTFLIVSDRSTREVKRAIVLTANFLPTGNFVLPYLTSLSFMFNALVLNQQDQNTTAATE